MNPCEGCTHYITEYSAYCRFWQCHAITPEKEQSTKTIILCATLIVALLCLGAFFARKILRRLGYQPLTGENLEDNHDGVVEIAQIVGVGNGDIHHDVQVLNER